MHTMPYKISISFIIIVCLIELNSASFINDLVTNVTYSLLDQPKDCSSARLDFIGMAAECGLTAEEFKVETKDNYVLTLFHISGNKDKCVLLMHGFLESADNYILTGNKSLVYQLVKEGYDVWVGNFRGNKYSRNNTKLNPDKDDKFWDFSFHEVGYYDMPANIDFILKKSGQTKLQIIGYSAGNTIVFVLLATRPEYNDKIKVCIALAPICHLQDIKPPILFAAEFAPALNTVAHIFHYKEVFGNHSAAKALLTLVCTTQLAGEAVCAQIGYNIFGFEPEEMPKGTFCIFLEHFPAGTSWQFTNHLAQMHSDKTFRRYDFGSTLGNTASYGVPVPPVYNLNYVTAKLDFYCAKGDRLSVIDDDVNRLKGELSNVVKTRVMARDTFNHGDYLMSESAHIDVYPLIIKDLETYNY